MYEWMNDVHTTSPCVNGKEIKVLFYADDVVFISKTIGEMRRALSALEEYCAKWKLSVNVNKSKIILATNGRIERSKYTNVKSFKYLGVVVSFNGKWDEHLERMTDKARRVLMSIRRYVYKYQNFPVRSREYDLIVKIKKVLLAADQEAGGYHAVAPGFSWLFCLLSC